jgi:hypothetical protein
VKKRADDDKEARRAAMTVYLTATAAALAMVLGIALLIRYA